MFGPDGMSRIIGIDLGTTNSCAAVVEGDEGRVAPRARRRRAYELGQATVTATTGPVASAPELPAGFPTPGYGV